MMKRRRPVVEGEDSTRRLPAQAHVVARVLGGDTEAFRDLVTEHHGAVLGLCRRLLFGKESEAEEVAQETFLNALKYLSTLQDPTRFSPWLYQIARSLCRDRRRRWKVEARALAERAEWERRRALMRSAPREEGELDTALNALPEQERRVLELRYFEGLSYKEICRCLRLSFSQVDHLIRKARSRLARRLASGDHVEQGVSAIR